MGIRYEIRKILWKLGCDVVRYQPTSHPLARRRRLLDSYQVGVVLDVGANTGQYARQMRDIGFSGQIISFEPLSSAFKVLRRNAAGDPRWHVMNYALGDFMGKTRINIAGNTDSSSLLEMLPLHAETAPDSVYVGSEMIEVKTLDSVFEDICSEETNIYLKVDTQGFESKVIKGAEESLPYIGTIQIEMPLVPLYKDETLFNEMYSLLNSKGYALISIETGFSDSKTGQILQIDGIFHRF